MFLIGHTSGILELKEDNQTGDEGAILIEVSDSFTFEPGYEYAIVDGEVKKYQIPDESSEANEQTS